MRRSFMVMISLAGGVRKGRWYIALAAAAAMLGAVSIAAADRPNILFILVDDLGYGDPGCYGQVKILTPSIDRIASEGMRFTQAYAGSTVCAPSRCSLMTGLHTGHATVRGNKRPELGLRADEPDVPTLLKGAGYSTVLLGKWGLGGPGTGSVPNLRGFDQFFGYLDQLHAHNYYPGHLWENQDEFFMTSNWFFQRKEYAPDLFTRRALEFLRHPPGTPFFMYLCYTIPHADNELGRLTGNGMEVPDNHPYSDREWPDVEKNFAAMVTRMDSDIGRILDLLSEAGLDRSTVVFFTSDNGPHKEGGHDPDFFDSNGRLRGIKRDLYEGGIRVPFIVRWPGRVAAGTVSDQVVAFWDFLPTAGDLAGAGIPAGRDGRSIVPTLLGGRQEVPAPLYWEFHESGFSQAVRTGDWKGVRLDVGRNIELYDLRTDPGEQNDIAVKHPDVVKNIARLMDAEHTDSAAFPVKARTAQSPRQ
jgi:arylsulfatase A-like enzyme